MLQVIHIAKAGKEPAFTDCPKEDMTLQGLPSSAGVPICCPLESSGQDHGRAQLPEGPA